MYLWDQSRYPGTNPCITDRTSHPLYLHTDPCWQIQIQIQIQRLTRLGKLHVIKCSVVYTTQLGWESLLYHFICTEVGAGDINLQAIGTEGNIAGILPKALPMASFFWFVLEIHMYVLVRKLIESIRDSHLHCLHSLTDSFRTESYYLSMQFLNPPSHSRLARESTGSSSSVKKLHVKWWAE